MIVFSQDRVLNLTWKKGAILQLEENHSASKKYWIDLRAYPKTSFRLSDLYREFVSLFAYESIFELSHARASLFVMPVSQMKSKVVFSSAISFQSPCCQYWLLYTCSIAHTHHSPKRMSFLSRHEL